MAKSPNEKGGRQKTPLPPGPPQPPGGNTNPPITGGGFNPLSILREAIAAVPAVRYALGVCGIAAAIAIAAGFTDLRYAIVGVPVVLLLMIILLIFSKLAANKRETFRGPTNVLVWFSVVMMVLVTSLFTLAFFFKVDVLNKIGLKGFYELFTPDQPGAFHDPPDPGRFIRDFDAAYSGQNDPKAVAAAAQRISSFWRGDEQTEFLLKFRCKQVDANAFFKKSAEYVRVNAVLRDDVDALTRYYDAAARCANAGKCKMEEMCGYFNVPSTEFRMQYSDYFAGIAALEGHDPIENVRNFNFTCGEVTPKLSTENLDCKKFEGAPVN